MCRLIAINLILTKYLTKHIVNIVKQTNRRGGHTSVVHSIIILYLPKKHVVHFIIYWSIW